MQAEGAFGKLAPHRLAQEFPAPLCRSCNVAMWVIKRDDEIQARLDRFGYNCRLCGETMRHVRHGRIDC